MGNNGHENKKKSRIKKYELKKIEKEEQRGQKKQTKLSKEKITKPCKLDVLNSSESSGTCV
jgi:hypothetical protein